MLTSSFVAASGLLLSLVAAVPMQHMHHQRDIVWVTSTSVTVVTVPVTKTVVVDEAGATEAAQVSSTTTPASSPAQATSQAAVPPTSTTLSSTSISTSISASISASSSSSSSSTTPAASPSTSSAPVVDAAPAPSPATTSSSTSTSAVPTTSTSATPTTTPTPAAATPSTTSTTPAAPAATSAAATKGDSLAGLAAPGTSYTGDLTWYDDGLGACGITNGPSDHIVAISHVLFDAYSTGNPNTNPLCGKTVTITGADGSPYQAKIVDRCVGCALGDLDLSQDFFKLVVPNGNGRVPGMHWSFPQ